MELDCTVMFLVLQLIESYSGQHVRDSFVNLPQDFYKLAAALCNSHIFCHPVF